MERDAIPTIKRIRTNERDTSVSRIFLRSGSVFSSCPQTPTEIELYKNVGERSRIQKFAISPTMTIERRLLMVPPVLCASVLLICLVQSVDGFAYAPNFITKIVAEQTGKEPVGLLELPPTSPTETTTVTDNTDAEETASTTTGSGTVTATATVTKPTVTDPVTTRFPPEPNGYLHLGHAKAVSFNFAVSRMFGGRCNMRMDDTNPSKEGQEYVDSILEDVQWIQSGLFDGDVPWEGDVRKTSDYFELIYDCAVALIKSGDAYVDSLTAEEMREYRGTLTEPGKNSPYRGRSVEENLELFTGVSKRYDHGPDSIDTQKRQTVDHG